MACVFSMRNFFRFRLSRVVYCLLFLVILIALILASSNHESVRLRYLDQPENFDILENRKNFRNVGYSSTGTEGDSIDDKCARYFSNLPSSVLVDLDYLVSFELNHLVYNRDRWERQYRRDTKKRLTREGGKKYTVQHEIEGEILLNDQIRKHSELENKAVVEFNHMRVFGKCFLTDNGGTSSAMSSNVCKEYESKLYPWVSREIPNFQDDEGNVIPNFDAKTMKTGCFLQNWKDMSSGKGIVIHVSPSNSKRLVSRIKRLLKTLVALDNTLPIQIIFSGKDLLYSERSQLIEIVKNHGMGIWFVDLEPVVIESKRELLESPNFVLGLATIFHSFEDAIIMSDQTIPLTKELKKFLFDNERYLEHGLTFFKKPSYPISRRTKYEPGFHEVSHLIKTEFMPNTNDFTVFGLSKRNDKISTSQRVLEHNFQEYIDSNMIVLNKRKVMSGLLLGINLQMYKIFEIRFDENNNWSNYKTAEFLWLGQEMSGVNKFVNFNLLYGVGIGVATPNERKPMDLLTTSEELCSSSWGQISDIDERTLIYVTSHQGDNWVRTNNGVSKFQLDIKDKFSWPVIEEVENFFVQDEKAAEKETITIKENNMEVFEKTFQRNPFSIDTVILPATLVDHAGDSNFVEPSFSWIKQDEFGGQHDFPYWCCYDVVGKPDFDRRGL